MKRESKLSAALLLIIVIMLNITGCDDRGKDRSENNTIEIPNVEQPLSGDIDDRVKNNSENNTIEIPDVEQPLTGDIEEITETSVTTSGGLEMSVNFIDVGQADAIFIDYGEYEVLIDGGNRKDGKPVYEYIKPYVDGPVELIIATHPDADHIGGLIDVINMIDVDTIIYNGEKKDTQTYRDFESAAKSKQNCEFVTAEDTTIDMGGDASIHIIPPVKIYNDVNENSIVSLLEYGDVSVLFTGDMETKSEKDLMDRFSKVDVLKAAHHGSKTSSSAQFLSITQPDYVIISAGLNNKYKHPNLDALQRYFDIGATVYGTFKDGAITMNTDGKSYSFSAKTEVTLDDAGDRSVN